MVPVGSFITSILIEVILFAILFLISWLISKKIKKNIFIIAITLWIIVFFANALMILSNIPFAFGIKNSNELDGGINGKYISLGYAIKVEGHNLFGKSKYNVYLTSIFK